jgi:hypothetical protein
MREITFDATPPVLREIATFLNEMAAALESGRFTHRHEHIDTVVKEWRHRFPQVDVIVTHPHLP